MVQELAGLGGDVGFIKHELNYQLNVPVTDDVVSRFSTPLGLQVDYSILLLVGYPSIFSRRLHEEVER